MKFRHSRVCSIVFAGALAVAGPALAQSADSRPATPGPMELPAGATIPSAMEIKSQIDAARTILSSPEMRMQIDQAMDAVRTIPSSMEIRAQVDQAMEAVRTMPSAVEMRAQIDEAMDAVRTMPSAMAMMAQIDRGRSEAFSQDRADRQADAEQREKERETRVYDQGRELIDQGKYDQAIGRFNDVVAMKGARADAALYQKAYSQNKAGQRPDALSTISTLAKDYPKSRYLKQARALEAEIKRDSGQPARPETENDDELKLMALNALVNSDPEKAVPILEKLLEGTAAPKLKSKALFVLAQSNSPRAREVLKGIAKGNSTPELQNRAIDYLGQQGGAESRAALGEIYTATSDVDVKRRILRAFMVAGEKGRLLSAAQGEQNADLRAEAVQQLGVMGAHDEVWQLYQKETAVEVKKRIIQAMFVGNDTTRLIELAKTEKDPELRRTAVRNLGIMDSARTSAALLEIYNSDKDPAIRKAVIQGLFQQNNAQALVDLARKEQDPAAKKDIVQKLSVMGGNTIATAYMLELLNGK